VYLAVAGQDTLRDDGLLFKQKLDDSKCVKAYCEREPALTSNRVATKFDFYEGYPHYHWTWPSPKLKKPREEFNANLASGVQFVVA
jgi:versiconal hemiacetal acetate esterase